MKFHVDIDLHVETADADIMFIFPNIIQDRFSGTVIHIDNVKTTRVIEVESRDKKKDIISGDNRTEEMCTYHYQRIGRFVYLVDGVCPVFEEHDASNSQEM